ncbi:nucleotide pyrophosphohydrolase [Undibacterium umbellatum]|uniref:Nucleotide pyrophosphohydrolase n=1 Tax=Undibacterium umbellatum TaxID=2762300 RepID=A0ABR6ZEN2_9BURK|nr:nucleotide pyrophosphohydrolase [Undibacterium umbellatum]MBC3909826.1 nucleotide pyrophosphohydrolase [Undibacterium umbellatum]
MSQTTTAPEVQYTDIRDRLRQFVAERDWAQFHTPKNLASALTVEAAELLEIFQWLPTGKAEELDEQARTAIRHEMADVLNYLVMLADALDVDLFAASMEKIVLNAIKYPVAQVKGDARKYTEYETEDKSDKP